MIFFLSLSLVSEAHCAGHCEAFTHQGLTASFFVDDQTTLQSEMFKFNLCHLLTMLAGAAENPQVIYRKVISPNFS